MKKLDVHSLALAYLWHVVLGGDETTARRAAPLILAIGLLGPHPPKLAKAVVRAFGGELEDVVVRWFSQPLHGTLYEAIRKVAHGAVYRRFGVGDDELCQGSVEGPCRLVEICSEVLVGVPRKGYGGVEEVAEEYAKYVAKVLDTPGLSKKCPIDALIRDFLRAYNGISEDGRWRIRYETKRGRAVEDVVDELDVLSALYGLAVLPGWDPRLKPLEGWFFVGDEKVEVVRLYLFPLLRERGRELVKRVVAIAYKAKRRGFYTAVDLWQAVGIATAGRWDSATDEEVEKAVKLAATALRHFATALPIVLRNVWPLLSEAWRRIVGGGSREDGGRRRRLADRLIAVAYSVAKGYPFSLPLFFAVGIGRLDLETVAKRFDALYNAASNAGKLWLLDLFLHVLELGIVGINIVAVLLGKYGAEEAFEEIAKRVEELVSKLDGVEKAYVMARLYPPVARRYASFGNFGKAVELVDEMLKALDGLWGVHAKDRESTEKELRPYLELKWVKPNLEEELNELSRYVYHYVALVYMDSKDLGKAVEFAEKACELARNLSDVYYEDSSCGLLLRLRAVISAPTVEEFEERWQRMWQVAVWPGAEDALVALTPFPLVRPTFLRLLYEVGIAMERWSWVLELRPVTGALTYGVLSLFDERHLEKAVEGLPERARAYLPRLADALHDAVEVGLFAKEPSMVESARKKLLDKYGEDVVKALDEIAQSDKLFLSALVGLTHCKRGEEWGLKLARATARAGSTSEGIVGRLFGELAKALKGASVGNCVTEEVLGAVYNLYCHHVWICHF